MVTANMTPVQMVLGLSDAAGAAFLFDDAISVIGDPADCEQVLQVARLCTGTRTVEAITAAVAGTLSPERVDTILTTLVAEGIVQEADPTGGTTDSDELQRANALLARFVGDGKLISHLEVYKPALDADDERSLPLFFAQGLGRLANGTAAPCHGSALTPAGAALKAIAEAVERYCIGAAVRFDAFCRAEELAHPTLIFKAVTRQQPAYLAEKGLVPFASEAAHPWVLAHSLGSQAPAYLLADTVYAPLTATQLGRPPVSQTRASGAAAHATWDEAVRRALFELIERDALMVTWYAQRPVTALPVALASPAVQERLADWSAQGRDFRLLNLTLDSVPVVLALSEGDRYPFITAGCAAAATFTEAIEKAFGESEAIALSWALRHDPLPTLSAALSPMDHGLLYAHPGNEARVDWLLDAPTAAPVVQPVSMAQLIDRFAPLVVTLHTPEAADDLWVVRVFSDRLLPITFGYASEPHGHARLRQLGLRWGSYPSYPHFLA